MDDQRREQPDTDDTRPASGPVDTLSQDTGRIAEDTEDTEDTEADAGPRGVDPAEQQRSAEEFAQEHDPAKHDVAAGADARQRGDWTADEAGGPQVWDADGTLVEGDAPGLQESQRADVSSGASGAPGDSSASSASSASLAPGAPPVPQRAQTATPSGASSKESTRPSPLAGTFSGCKRSSNARDVPERSFAPSRMRTPHSYGLTSTPPTKPSRSSSRTSPLSSLTPPSRKPSVWGGRKVFSGRASGRTVTSRPSSFSLPPSPTSPSPCVSSASREWASLCAEPES